MTTADFIDVGISLDHSEALMIGVAWDGGQCITVGCDLLSYRPPCPLGSSCL